MAIKRHQALQDYSREHHYELLLVWKIREGLRKNISKKRIIEYLVYHFEEMTSKHMAKEEKYILNKLPENDKDRNKILSEHKEADEMVKKLSNDLTDENNLLSEFADKLEQHIRYEERIFFEKLQNEFPEEIINSMEPLENKMEDDTDWKDPFWENKSR